MARRPSEFTGKTQRNGLFPEVPDVLSPAGNPPEDGRQLTAQEQMRLVYSTGQETDPTLDRDPAAFQGDNHKTIRDAADEETTRQIVEWSDNHE